MESTVKVGQVWRDKDKRRGTVVEIIAVHEPLSGDTSGAVTALVVGTERETTLKLDRLTKRWELIEEKANPLDELNRELETLLKDEPEIAADIPVTVLKTKHKTREAWLEAAVKSLTKTLFKPLDVTVPDVRVSVGWPGGRGPKGGVIGQCWKTETASDKVSQIFISPVVDEPVKALATLAHEMIHASDDGASGHRGHFAKTAKGMGFQGKLTVVDPSEDLTAKLKPLAEALGAYPHAAISVASKPKVQKTYMRLLESVECTECEDEKGDFYKLRMTAKWIENFGAPLCPHGIEMEEA